MSGFLKRPISLSLEMIEFQNDDFGQRLEAIIAEIIRGIGNGTFPHNADLEGHALIRKLESTIFSRLGIKTNLDVSNILAATMPFYVNKKHIFLDPHWRDMDISISDQQKVINKLQGKKGSVNTATAKVSGFFSEYEHVVYMNFHDLIKFNLTEAEITAILLHELGHDFTTLEYSNRLNSLNQIFANVALRLTSDKKKDQLEYIYKELKTVDAEVSEQDVDDIVNGNRIIAGVKMIKTLFNSVDTQMRESTYDKTASEQMADNFANRFGYGRHLVSALDKISDRFYNPEKSRLASILTWIFELNRLLGMIIVAGSLAAYPIHACMALFILYVTLRTSAEDCRDYTYDELKFRYKRVRQDMVEQIKAIADKGGNKKQLQEMLDSIYYIDSIIEKTYIYKSVFRLIGNAIFAGGRKADRAIKEQQLMEELATNDLFLEAAHFKIMGA